MFNKNIEIKDNKLIITVSIKKRKYISEERKTFKEDITLLIPKEYQSRVSLLTSPVHKISNFTSKNCKTHGEWVFEIENKKNETTRKPTRRKRSTQRAKKN